MKYKMPASLVRQVREAAQMSQRTLAGKAGTAQSVVARIELGETDPSWKTLSRLIRAAGYNLSVELQKNRTVDPSELDDIRRILKLTPEQRLLEVAHVSRFVASARRV